MLLDRYRQVLRDCDNGLTHKELGDAGAGGKSASINILEPAVIDLVSTVDPMRDHPAALHRLDKACGIGAVATADDHDQLGLARDLTHGVLPILCRVADVISRRRPNCGEARAQ